MAPLEDAQTIDIVAATPDRTAIGLIVVASNPWPATGEGALLLQAKLKSYVAFVTDGQLLRQFPDAQGKRVVIQIRTAHPLGATEEKLVALAREHWCKPEGISLVVSVRDHGKPPGPDSTA